MPVKVVLQKPGFLDFMVQKLGDEYPVTLKTRGFLMLKDMAQDPYHFITSDERGRAALFRLEGVDAKKFFIQEMAVAPQQGVLDLTMFSSVPEFIQKLVDEYMQLNPEYELEVKLSEQLG